MTIKIKFNPIKTRIEGLSIDVIETLKSRLICYSFLNQEKYKDIKSKSKLILVEESNEEDNLVYTLLEEFKSHIEFPTGLIVKVIKYLKTVGLTYTLEKIIESAPLDIKKYPNILRDHQVQIIDKCIKSKRGTVKSPTASGKSWIIAEFINQFQSSVYKLILVPTVTLLYQMQKDISEYLNIPLEDIGLIGDDNNNSQYITVAIPDTLTNRVRDWNQETINYLHKVQVLIVDEYHTCLTPTMFSIVDELINTEYRIGLSATPPKDGVILMEAILGPEIISFSEKDMMDKEIILSPTIYFNKVEDRIPLDAKLSNFKFESGEFGPKEMVIYNKLYDKVIVDNIYRNELATNIVEKRIEEGHTVLILVKKVGTSKKGISHAQIFKDLLLERKGIDLHIIHGKSTDRPEALEDLENGVIKGLIASVGILSEGVSIKSISSLILLAGGKTEKDFIQRVGRVLRKKDGKLAPTVDDFLDCQSVFINQSKSRLDYAIEIYGKDNVHIIV